MATTTSHIDRTTPMGANIVPGGVTFRVWAPAAQQMFVLTGASLTAAEQPGFSPSQSDAMFSLRDQTWGAFVPGLIEGSPYRLWVVGSGSTGFKRDPYARELSTVPAYPNCDCLVRATDTYPWHDGSFHPPEFRDLILYQLHVGVYFAVDTQGRDRRKSVGKFLDLLDRVEYLHDLGINAVQLLPIQEFPTETSRGYNGLDLYSPEMDYHVSDVGELSRYLQKANTLLAARGQGAITLDHLRPGPNQLRCIIDVFHLYGVAVLFDLVFNHAGPGFNDHSLWFFDRQPYGDDNRSLYFTDHKWVGGRIFAYWDQNVRQFLINNALSCLQEYHIDGVRYDEVSVIDNNGGGRFCQDLVSTARFVKPQAIQIAEYWKDDRAAAVKPVPQGLGFDAAWGDKVRDGVRSVITQASGGQDALVNIEALRGSLDTPGGFSAAWQVVNCLENHDIVFDGQDRRLASLADPSDARSWYARSRTRVATGLLLMARGIPMLFMGQEILEDKPWSDDVNFHANLFIWWDGLQSDKVMQDHLRFCQDLLRMRRSQPALRSESLRVSRVHNLDRVVAIHRWIEGEGSDLLFVANVQEFNRLNYRIGFPSAGRWREIFNSDYYDNFPNSKVAGNGGAIVADGETWDDMPASAEIAIPANGFIVFSR